MRHNIKKTIEHNFEVISSFFNYLFSNYSDTEVFVADLLHTAWIKSNEEKLPELEDIFSLTQELFTINQKIAFSYRDDIAAWLYFEIDLESKICQEITVKDFLELKERKFSKSLDSNWLLDFDMTAFLSKVPSSTETNLIGKGIEEIKIHLEDESYTNKIDLKKLIVFLKDHQYKGESLLLNSNITNLETLKKNIKKAESLLKSQSNNESWESFETRLKELGFDPGWGKDKDGVLKRIGLLQKVIVSPHSGNLVEFLTNIPAIFSVVIFSPHGFFGQSDVLGFPDTGGQVVYILDQVRALEKQLISDLKEFGLAIKPKIIVISRLIPNARGSNCNQEREHIHGSENAEIIRIPFWSKDGEIIDEWISRFKVWPYMERFALDSKKQILKELGDVPSLLVGNYSDGNLVASMLASKFNSLQCNIAHALEKTKYPQSDIYWKKYEEQYNFSVQYSADLYAMNSADFIITSTFQEIAGTKTSLGQYESHMSYTLPDLYRVSCGIDVYDSKFNIIPPGVDTEVFFPYSEIEKRNKEMKLKVNELVYSKDDPTAVGYLEDKSKKLLFAMSRVDRVKNISGFLEEYAQSPKLQQIANVLIVGGVTDENRSKDAEEKDQIKKIHHIIETHNLYDRVRWIEMQTDKQLVSELYRFVADLRGAFVQPAFFEAFGLTVLEAMSSGLPTFATKNGGPLESIENNISGFHIDPHSKGNIGAVLVNFFEKVYTNPSEWMRISHGAINKVENHYKWSGYAKKMLKASNVYKYLKSTMPASEKNAYLDMFYSLVYRKMANAVERFEENCENEKN